jgi:radical SAM protein with 4Fe4S-binding SPASM domain
MPTATIPHVNPSGDHGKSSGQLSAPYSAEGSSQRQKASGFSLRPLQVTWEMTRACEWKPARARASARREQCDLPTAEAFHLIDEIAAMHVPLLALTGGDPLLRHDLLPIVQYASHRSVRTSLTALPTPLLTREVIQELKDAGLMRMALWLHGSTALLHDAFWGVAGSYRCTLDAISWCHEAQLPIQVNTTIAQRNLHDLDPMIELLTRLDVVLWNVFFLVPASREQADELLSAEEHEEVFAKLYAASKRVHFQIKTTEGQHYQRYLLQQRARESHGRMTEADAITCAPKGVNDGKGFVFVNHAGQVYPSRFLPLCAGDITSESLSDVYCDSELFISLRDSSKLKGKCRRCAARAVCGGSRARAYVMTGDPLAEDPCCSYQP